MRKIKITALLLAVLMIVTAFAGCASKSTVTNLDDKVNDLDGKIQEQADALAGIQSSLKDISSALENQGSSSELDDIKAAVESNKAEAEANKQSIAEILAAIEALKESIEANKDAIAGSEENDEEVKLAISKAGAKIDALKGAYEDNKANYKAEDLTAIREILGDAQATISACGAADAVSAALADMEAKLAAYKSVNGALYDYVVALTANIHDESAALVEEAYKALVAAGEFYEAGYLAKALTEYEVNGQKINLVTAIQALKANQENDLPKIKERALELVAKIDAATAKYDDTVLFNLLGEYKSWERDAKKLSEKNVALVTNYDKLVAALASAQNVQTALRDFGSASWNYPSTLAGTFGVDVAIFGDYEALGVYRVLFTYDTLDSARNLAAARVVGIYDAIDARLAEFKAEYDLNDAALEYIIETTYGDEYYVEKYESNKALAKAFAAEFDKLVAEGGVFANIKALNTKSLSATVSLALAQEFVKNATDINAWRDALVAAYKAEYAADTDAADTREVNLTAYKAILEEVFVQMTYEAKLGHALAPVGYICTCSLCQGSSSCLHRSDIDGFLVDVTVAQGNTDAYYFDLYDFACANNAKLANFLTVIYPKALEDAEIINLAIEGVKPYKEESIVRAAVKVGGYHQRIGDKLVAYTLDGARKAVVLDVTNGNVATIQEFNVRYNRVAEGYDLRGLINAADYDAQFALIEQYILEGEKALTALMTKLDEIHDGKGTVVVTTENMNEILKLEILLQNQHQLSRVDMEKATVIDPDATGVKEYKLAYIFEPFAAKAGYTRLDFYNNILYTREYAKTTLTDADPFDDVAGTDEVDTGWVIRLIYKARQLKLEAAMVESAWKAVKELKFDFASLDQLVKTIETINHPADPAKAPAVPVVNYDSNNNAFKVGTSKTIWNPNNIFGNTAWTSATLEQQYQIVINYLFGNGDGTLMNTIAKTDFEVLPAVLGANIPAFMMPILAMYLEAKFEINNMGIEVEAIEKAKNGWGAEGEGAYGFAYFQGMTAAWLRTAPADQVSKYTTEISALAATKSLEDLRRAVNNKIMTEPVDYNVWNDDIVFGGGEAWWLARTYDIRVKDYKNGTFTQNFQIIGDDTLYLTAHALDLVKIAAKSQIVSVWESEATCPVCDGWHCVSDVCPECGKVYNDAHDLDASTINVVSVVTTVKAGETIIERVDLEVNCAKACCAGTPVTFTETVQNLAYDDANNNQVLDDGEEVTFDYDSYSFVAVRDAVAGTWTTTVR